MVLKRIPDTLRPALPTEAFFNQRNGVKVVA
jgi:hypothetical protein